MFYRQKFTTKSTTCTPSHITAAVAPSLRRWVVRRFSAHPVKRSFYTGLLLGALMASGAFLLHEHDAFRSHPVPITHASKGNRAEPQWWLLPKDYSLAKLYTEPDALSVLDAPDAITVHRARPSGVSVLGYTFATEGISPTPDDAKTLRATFHALNAYTPVSACAFEPGVLIRLRRGEHSLDLLICFTCEDIAWVLDGHETHAPQAGLSDLGIGTLRTVFRRIFPDDPAFKLQ